MLVSRYCGSPSICGGSQTITSKCPAPRALKTPVFGNRAANSGQRRLGFRELQSNSQHVSASRRRQALAYRNGLARLKTLRLYQDMGLMKPDQGNQRRPFRLAGISNRPTASCWVRRGRRLWSPTTCLVPRLRGRASPPPCPSGIARRQLLSATSGRTRERLDWA